MDVLDVIGDFGRFQKEMLALISMRSFLISSTYFFVHMSSANVDHWCEPVEPFRNITINEWKECCVPKIHDQFSKCQRYALSEYGDVINNTAVACRELMYEGEIYESIRSEWNLACDRTWLLSLAYAALYTGNLISYPIAGVASDRFGRRNAVVFGCAGLLITNTALYFSNSLTWFLIIRFVSGLPYTFVQLSTITFFVEICGQRHRALTSIATGCTWALTSGLLLLVSMIVTRWRHTILIGTIPLGLPYLALCWKFMPESPRWLITKGQTEHAKEILHLATRKNGIRVENMNSVIAALEQKATMGRELQRRRRFMDFFKDKRLAYVTCVLLLSFGVDLFASSGFLITLRGLGGKVQVNFAICAGLDFFCSIISSLVMHSITRRRCLLAVCFALSGSMFFVATILGEGYLQWMRITVALLAKMFTTLIFHALTLYANEVFPTSMRGMGSSICMTAGRVGSLCSSFTIVLSQNHGPNAPYFLFGSLTWFTAILYTFVPETTNKNLPDSLEESKMNMYSTGNISNYDLKKIREEN